MGSSKRFRRNRNVVFSCKYHVIWCTKYRRPVLNEAIQERFKLIAYELGDELDGRIVFMEEVEDHVHLLVNVEPQFGMHKFVKRVKGRSSRLLRQEYKSLRTRLPTLWANSYFVATVGGTPRETMKQYIEEQRGK